LVALARHLEQRRAQGEEFVWLSPKARKELRELPTALARIQHATTASKPGTEAKPAPKVAPAPAATPSAPVKPAPPVPPAPVVPSVAVSPPPPSVPASEVRLVPEGATKAEKLRWLAERAKDFPAVRELDSLRDIMVFAVGSPDARLMFVGEAPGAEEERQGEPFVGPAGQLLTKMIAAMGVKREETYISNIVKFRPAIPNQGESNRKPTAEEMAACLCFVRAEIEVIRPEVIVALGGTAAQGLLGVEEPVSRLRNQFYSFEGIPLMVTFHPSYLLRNTALSERRKVWEDLLLVMERLGLPISPKQRAFFTA
jgi:DNA polymerase